MSILVFYLRVFVSLPFRRLVFLGLTLAGLILTIFTFLVTFQCSPVKHAWQFWDGERPGSCHNVNAIIWAMAAANLALDLYVMSIPFPQLITLSLSRKKKLYILAMFSVGFL